jgi:hypothetical protein
LLKQDGAETGVETTDDTFFLQETSGGGRQRRSESGLRDKT